MMRTLISLMVALGTGIAATAATVTVETDKKTYLSGETITVTTTLTTSGAEPQSVLALLDLIWSDPQIAGVPGPAVFHTVLTSGGGAFNWTPGLGGCLAGSCFVVDQLSPNIVVGSVPDAATVTSTLTMVADAIGLLNFSFGATFLFGATPTLGANASIAEIVSPDMDSDGVPDSEDICKMDPMAPLLCGLDTDQDGYGNACDCDLNNDGLIGGLDYAILLPCYFAGSDPTNAGCDLNCDGLVNGLDFAVFFPHFLAPTPPGPSGLPCAGTVPCLP